MEKIRSSKFVSGKLSLDAFDYSIRMCHKEITVRILRYYWIHKDAIQCLNLKYTMTSTFLDIFMDKIREFALYNAISSSCELF